MIRKLGYLLSLARERHFGRAAAAVHISQPTLSNAIRQLEQDLRVPIVVRGRVFQGFTPEGEKVLEYARQILADCAGLRQELGSFGQGLSGVVRIGVIPTALPAVAHLVTPFSARHPHVRTQILSSSSRDIQRGLDEFSLDAAVTYLDNEALVNVRMAALYSEHYFLLTQRSGIFGGRTSLTWTEAAGLPLCLLTPDMQNRRIVESAFRMAGCAVRPAMETNSLINLCTMVSHGPWSSIIPGQLVALWPPGDNLIALHLTGPDIAHVVGLVYADRTPAIPSALALAKTLTEDDVPRRIAEMTRQALMKAGIDSPALLPDRYRKVEKTNISHDNIISKII
ncbi:LysR family transcriptional regulator [Telmatospirillum siberiense]|uniref:LysR family transcriptional regulator n=1 Tax=Telmatospirillum siberiense TaxID=382514 RepID=A0A2N3PYZ6_9PROT|nr:LysR family transcriptional regulator [Telmatospirillum siberiense]PKU25605.1 LysR family transcriptional regulator [Telmatospirillum siberiense]